MAIDPEALENSIRIHGILLEHRVQGVIDKTLSELRIVPHRSEVSYSIAKQPGNSGEVCEIDVYVEPGYYKVDPLDDLFTDKSHENMFADFSFGARVQEFFIVECKGHLENGFLLTRSCESPHSWGTPLLVDPEDRRVTERMGVGNFNFARIYRAAPPQQPIPPYFIDWAYFYTDNKIDLDKNNQTANEKTVRAAYKQDRDRSTNKFLKAVYQLNDALDSFFHIKPGFKAQDSVQRITPLIVTNAPIVVLNIDSLSKQVSAYSNVPWVCYYNPYASQRQFASLGILDVFFVVSYSHLANFLRCHHAMINTVAQCDQPSKGELLHSFSL